MIKMKNKRIYSTPYSFLLLTVFFTLLTTLTLTSCTQNPTDQQPFNVLEASITELQSAIIEATPAAGL